MGPNQVIFTPGTKIAGNANFTDQLNEVAAQAAEPVQGDNVGIHSEYVPGVGYVLSLVAPPQDPPEEPEDFFFLAEITGNLALGSTNARWKYSWRECEFDGDSYSVLSGGRAGSVGTPSGADLGYALNINEMTITTAKSGTTAWYVDGVQANSTTTNSAYPTQFAPRPIGAAGSSSTHVLNALVWMRDTEDKNGNRRFYFSAKMNHDGSCS